MATTQFAVSGTNDAAPFTLKLHRGDGMLLLGMNWKGGKPPNDFVGFAIEYREPGGNRIFPLKNRLTFPGVDGEVDANVKSTRLSPIQKFRWVHFPRNANLDGKFYYRVTPVFMSAHDDLSYGPAQEAEIELRRDTYAGQLNVTFTRGFVSSQAFVDRYIGDGPVSKLIPGNAKLGLKFKPTHPDTKDALRWMGFEAREEILATLDAAIADEADVYVVAYELNQPDIVDRLKQVGKRLKIIIDDSKEHKPPTSAESQAAAILKKSAGAGNVKRQHMGSLQHNKTIVVDGPNAKKVVCGSTNLSWRGLFIQNNNAVILEGDAPVAVFRAAFEDYWKKQDSFESTDSAGLNTLGLAGIDAQVAFSPHSSSNALLQKIADDVAQNTTSSLLYSLAFLYQTPGPILKAIKTVTKIPDLFVYGISDKQLANKKVGFELQKPDGKLAPVFPAALDKDVPPPFNKEPSGGGGVRLHHKFLVLDFDKPTARVYLGSYNFSDAADKSNGENLLLIRDQRIATSYMIEALRIFDHYHFRVAQQDAKKARKKLQLARPPRNAREKPWWDEDYSDPVRIKDRELFS